MVDFEYIALTLSSMTSIPIRLYREGSFVKVCHSVKFRPDLALLEEPNIFRSTAAVSYYMTPECLIYGLFRAKDAPVCLVLGPVSHIPIDRVTAQNILRSIGESPARAGELMQYLKTIPSYPLNNFLQILCSLAYMINGEKLDVADFLLEDVPAPSPPIPERSPHEFPKEQEGHNTYGLEQTLLSLVEYGRPEELEAFFRMPVTGRPGTMAHDALRQQKNLIIVTATLYSRAAIRGGLDYETALSLSDMYIQKAELLNDYETLFRMMSQMILDYARRVQRVKCMDSPRSLVRSVRQYILSHIHEKITTEDLARALGRNRSYLSTSFQEETGMTLTDFIARTRIDEAKRLLTVTDKPLKDIACQLGFSSQSYFQNVFKKLEGITPAAYRSGRK